MKNHDQKKQQKNSNPTKIFQQPPTKKPPKQHKNKNKTANTNTNNIKPATKKPTNNQKPSITNLLEVQKSV